VVLCAAVAFVVIFAAPSAFAKGPSQGVITGAGLAHPITLREPGSATIGPDLASVVTQSGFFVGMWGGDDTSGRLAHRPAGSLGPRYTITYTIGGAGPPSTDIVQYVFPYAEPGPITFMPPNQAYWGTAETDGGWFAATVGFRETLIGLGLPETPQSAKSLAVVSDEGDPISTAPRGSATIPLWMAGALVAVAFAATLRRRRRPRRSVHA